jgi:hypothetical protein
LIARLAAWQSRLSCGRCTATILSLKPSFSRVLALPSEAIWRLVTYLQSLQPAKDTLSTTTW